MSSATTNPESISITSSSSSSSSSNESEFEPSFPDAEIVYLPNGSIDTVKTRIDFHSPKWESDFQRIRDAFSRVPALDEAALTAWSDSLPLFFGGKP